MKSESLGLKKGVGVRSSFKETGKRRPSLRGKFWIGDNEYGVLKYCLDNGLIRFTVREVADFLEVDPRRAYDAIQRLVARGWVSKVARGLYSLNVDPADVLSKYRVHRRSESMTGRAKKYLRDLKRKITQKIGRVKASSSQGKAHGTREPRLVGGGCGVPVVSGWRFDNVRGVVGCRYVGGDRGGVLGWEGLGLFDSLSYLEVQRWVGGVGVVDGLLAVYTNWGQEGHGIRVEWRPPRDFVKRNGVEGSVRGFWEAVLNALRALMSLLPYAPLHVFKRFVVWLRSVGVGKVLLDSLR